MKIGKNIKIHRKNPETGEWESIGNVISCDTKALKVGAVDESWEKYLKGKKEWSMTIDCTFIDWDETWLVAYQARFYAEYFKS